MFYFSKCCFNVSLCSEQDVNMARQSCSGLKIEKNDIKKCKQNPEKRCFAVGKEGVRLIITNYNLYSF